MCLDFKSKKSSNNDGINGRNHRLEIERTALRMHSQNTDGIVKLGIGQYKMQTADCRPGTKCRQEPRCSCKRALLLYFNLYENAQLVKRGIVIAVIYFYIKTEFHYAKRDSRSLSAYIKAYLITFFA